MRTVLSLYLGVAVLVCLPHQAHSQAKRQLDVRAVPDGPAERIHVQTHDFEETLAIRKRLVTAGAVRINCFLPDLIVFDLPAGVAMPDLDGVYGASFTAARAAGVEGNTPTLSWALDAYEAAEKDTQRPAATANGTNLAFDGEACAVHKVPREVVRRTQVAASAYPDARNILQNAEILVGNVVVNLIFLSPTARPAIPKTGPTAPWRALRPVPPPP